MPNPDAYARAYSGKTAQVVIDDEALVVIDYEHFRVHEGHRIIYHFLNLAVSDDAYADILIEVAADIAHFSGEVTAEGLAYVSFYEGPTLSAAGTEITGVNRARASYARAPLMTVSHTPTVSVVGTTLVAGRILPGGTNPAQAVGGRIGSEEWVLNANTDYLLRVQNKSGSAAYIEILLDMYEDKHD